MKKILFGTASITLIGFVPMIAIGATRFSNIRELIYAVHDIINILAGLALALAILYFFWGLAKFILRIGGDEGAVEDGKRIMFWGIIAIFVMVSVWGIVNFLIEAFGFAGSSSVGVPPEGSTYPPGGYGPTGSDPFPII